MTTATVPDLMVGDLAWLVSLLLHKAQHPMVQDGAELEIRPRYLRDKLHRGLLLTFAITPLRTRAERWGTLTLATGLQNRRLPFGRAEAIEAPVRLDERGVIWVDSLGVRVQLFPVDPEMPALARCLQPAADAAVHEALERAGRRTLGDDSLILLSAGAEPVRYKPGSRCTIRYHLELGEPAQIRAHRVTVYGKVYADQADAEFVNQTLARLHAATSTCGSRAVLPAPLGSNAELGLVLFEALAHDPGRHPLHPGSTPAECMTGLDRAAETLARLHACASEPTGEATAQIREAKRAQDRAALLAAACPEHAARLERIGEVLGRRLTAAPLTLRPVHGAMKPSHVLYSDGAAYLIDCDSTRLGDPAMDVGGFLAYLRPGGVWFGRRASRAWYDAAARRFVEAYRRSMSRLGVGEDEIESCLDRARAYECSRLLKVASRRPQRLNSVMPAELGAVCDAVERLLQENER